MFKGQVQVITMGISNLFYYSGKERIMVPKWCHFFAHLGHIFPYRGARYVFGLSLPARAFAASFLATGLVTARAARLNNRTAESHFKHLCSLKIGTKLVFPVGNRKKIGFFEGVGSTKELYDGKPAIKVSLPDKNRTTRYFYQDQALQVTIAPDQDIEVSGRQVGYTINWNAEFLDCLIKNVTPEEFALNSDFACAIIGHVNCLRQEIEHTTFYIYNQFERTFTKGTLQDVLRVRRFLSDGDTFKTDVFPASRSQVHDMKCNERPRVVIFDGSLGFVKWKDYYRDLHWVVLLDRTEPSYQEALETFNEEYMQNRDGEPLQLNLVRVPSGIELVAYKEACR